MSEFPTGEIIGDWEYSHWNPSTAKYLNRRNIVTGEEECQLCPAHYGDHWVSGNNYADYCERLQEKMKQLTSQTSTPKE